jgi:uncharacterized protein GlcG (DUF336 family)
VSERLTLPEAREILKRAVEKSREVQWISAYAVADEGGNIVSISRATSRRIRCAFTVGRACFPSRCSAARGAVPIVRNEKVIGGFSSSVSYAATGMQTVMEGKKFSREELVTAHALQIPYDDQHPDQP